jgi:hypothetical protein
MLWVRLHIGGLSLVTQVKGLEIIGALLFKGIGSVLVSRRDASLLLPAVCLFWEGVGRVCL